MLTLERCRVLLPDGSELSDEEVLEQRDLLYDLAEIAVDFLSHSPERHLLPAGTLAQGMQETSGDLTAREKPHERDDGAEDRESEVWAEVEGFDERAAIMEFDGGLERGEAERLALLDCIGRRRH